MRTSLFTSRHADNFEVRTFLSGIGVVVRAVIHVVRCVLSRELDRALTPFLFLCLGQCAKLRALPAGPRLEKILSCVIENFRILEDPPKPVLSRICNAPDAWNSRCHGSILGPRAFAAERQLLERRASSSHRHRCGASVSYTLPNQALLMWAKTSSRSTRRRPR